MIVGRKSFGISISYVHFSEHFAPHRTQDKALEKFLLIQRQIIVSEPPTTPSVAGRRVGAMLRVIGYNVRPNIVMALCSCTCVVIQQLNMNIYVYMY